MLQSKLFAKTKKSLAKSFETESFKLLYKGDFIDQLASGIFSLLPLGLRVHRKIENIIREELQKIGAQEVYLPALQPKSIWEASNRWKTMDPPLFKLKDRHQKEFTIAPTHEEVITKLVQERVSSYKDLPIALFQIQVKFRNELRFFGGLLRAREFIMKDLYSFHTDQEDFRKYYQKVIKAYFRIFKRCKLKSVLTEASGAGFTNEITHEFQVLVPAGQDWVFYCPHCEFAQNREISKLKAGDKCPRCKKGEIELKRGIEIANIFPLGDKYSKAFNLKFKDKDGKDKYVIMGCYGIGVGRLMATIVEVWHDENGIIWPEEIAPYFVHLVPLEFNISKVKQVSLKLYQDLQKLGIEVLCDDRKDKSPGEKLKDADLIGIPWRVVISKKTVKSGKIEIKKRCAKSSKLVTPKEFLNLLRR